LQRGDICRAGLAEPHGSKLGERNPVPVIQAGPCNTMHELDRGLRRVLGPVSHKLAGTSHINRLWREIRTKPGTSRKMPDAGLRSPSPSDLLREAGIPQLA
jgi:hypothetical protein